MPKQRRRDAALINQAPEGEKLLAELAQVAEDDPGAIPYVRQLISVLLAARRG